MDIYEIGTEKCIDGVWGREVNGRFYTHVNPLNQSVMYRKLDVNTPTATFFAHRSCDVIDKYEYIASDMFKTLVSYTPKHIKDLENLKRGDVVWLKIGTSFGEKWMSTRFVKKIQDYYITSNVFDGEGGVDEQRSASYKTVYLKPPFDF